MPFGLNIAPKIFTKLIRFVVHCLAQENIWCLPYLDDLLIIAHSREECLMKLEKAIDILQSLGWIINTDKSRLVPQQAFEWLGIHYDLENYKVKNTDQVCQNFIRLIREIVDQGWFTKRKLMSLQGVANWMGQVDPLRRTIISQTRRLLKILKPVPLQVKLTMDNRMKSAIAR